MLCHYGDTNDILHVRGLVDIGETPMEAGTRYCRESITFMQESYILSLFTVIDGINDLIPI